MHIIANSTSSCGDGWGYDIRFLAHAQVLVFKKVVIALDKDPEE